MQRVAAAASDQPTALETNGTVREARGFTSIIHTSPSFTASWMFISPTTPRRLAKHPAMRSTSRIVSLLSDIGGVMAAASPEWQPASSTCSSIAPTMVVSPSETQSTSSSIACVRNLSTSMERPSPAHNASSANFRRLWGWWTIAMPRPPRTKLGRTSTGYPISSAIFTASSTECAIPLGGWRTPSSATRLRK